MGMKTVYLNTTSLFSTITSVGRLFLLCTILSLSLVSLDAQIEICSNGVDDDGDGLIDCDDSDCATIHTCADADNDDIIDVLDSDNDNDGIIDFFEGYEMADFNTSIIQWLHLSNDATQDGYLPNFPVGEVSSEAALWSSGTGANTTYINGQGGSETVGAGITRNIVDNAAFISGVDQCCLVDAMNNNDYLEYSFTTVAGLENAFLFSHSMLDNLPAGSSQSWTEHHRSIFISDDDWTTYHNLTQDYLVEQSADAVPSEYPLYNKHFELESSTSYKVRIYFYASVNGDNAQVDDFGLLVNQKIQRDTDGDNIPDHYDSDSDGDGCTDAEEGMVYAYDNGTCFTGTEICNDGIDNDLDGLVDCADPDCQGDVNCDGAFACESGLYQVLSGQLKIFDPAILDYTPIGPVNPSYNGAGYNISDGFMYGMRTENSIRYIYKIKNDGTYEVHGEVTNGTDFLNYVGDINGNNQLVTYKSGSLYYVDLAQSSPMSYTTLALTNTTGGSNPSCHDIVYNAINDNIYLITPDVELWMIDENAATLTKIADLSADAPGISGANGAIWSDALGKLYFFNNASGNIYYITLNSSGNSVIDAGFLVAGSANGNNDGMSCPLALIPEICGNGLDDDGDSLIDCDDPDCSGSVDCDYLRTSGGSTGGLESNNRLSEKIARRNYVRAKTNTHNLKINTSERRIRRGEAHDMVGIRTGATLSEFIPVDIIQGAETFISTPDDLIDITNATEVMSVDYFADDERIGSILATTTVDGVYEHTKYICDRLHGTKIENIWNYKIDGKNPFIVTKFFHPSGEAEYASSFSIYEENGAYRLESHWNLSDYTENDSYFNFQVWANNPANLENIVQNILALIKEEAPIDLYNCGAAPNLFVEQLSYKNHKLTMDVINKPASLGIQVEGNTLDTETSNEEEIMGAYGLDGGLRQQIEIHTDGIYGLGLTLNHEKQTVPDGIYYADGSWGLDYLPEEATVDRFEIFSDGAVPAEDAYKVERNIELTGQVSGKMAVYRSLNAAYRPVDLSNYNTLGFTASGNFTLEVTIVKNSVHEWEEHMRTSVYVNGDDQRIVLPVSRFSSPQGQLDWSDVKMIVFSVLHFDQSEAFELGLNDVVFSNETENTDYSQLAPGEGMLFPNPVKTTAQIVFNSPANTKYTYRLFSASGVLVEEIQGNAIIGLNEVLVRNNNYPTGVYWYEIVPEQGNKIQGKVMMTD